MARDERIDRRSEPGARGMAAELPSRELSHGELERVAGGMLLPAIQKVREA